MLNHKCNLIVDSCCDLPYAMLNREGVELLKFPYIMSDGDHLDDMYTSLEPHAFYESIRKGEAPSTAQISMPTLLSAFNNAAASGVPTVFLCFSSGLSGTYDTACMALDQVKSEHPDAELYIVDTKLASIAEGMLVAEALRQRDNGLTAEELVAWAEEAVYYVGCLFMVEDLDSLARGGRLPSVGAYLGSKLDVKPMVSFDLEGHLSMAGVSRGRKKGIRQLAEAFEKNAVKEPGVRHALIAHADCPKDCAKLKEMLLKSDPELLIIESNIGPVIGCHVGPGMIACVYWGEDRRKSLSLADRIAKRVKGE